MDSLQNQERPQAHCARCPLEKVLKMVGGKYKALILWHLREGPLRWSEVRRSVMSASDRMLSRQLRELERDGLILRTVYQTVPPQTEYRLAELGQSVMPLLEGLSDRGRRVMGAEEPEEGGSFSL